MNKTTLMLLNRLRHTPPTKFEPREREHFVWVLGLMEGWGMRGEHEGRLVDELTTLIERLHTAAEPPSPEDDE